MQFKVIFVSGKVGSGKDTFIERYFQTRKDLDHGYFATYTFANELKRMLINAGWDGKKDLKGRKLLQSVGNAFREYQKDYWVNFIKHAIDKEMSLFVDNNDSEIYNVDVIYLVMTDCRYKNEICDIINHIEATIGQHFDVIYKWYYVIGNNHDVNREMDDITVKNQSEIEFDELIFSIPEKLYDKDISVDLYLNNLVDTKLHIINNNGSLEDFENKIQNLED